MKFHWSLLDDQLRWGSGFSQLTCVTSYFTLSIWQLLMYFCVEEYGIYFYYLLSVCTYKDRCVCTCVHTHARMDVYRHSHHTQINVLGKPLPLSAVINHALVRCRLQLTWMGRAWRFGLLCPNLFPCIKKLQNQPAKTPPSSTTKLEDTWEHSSSRQKWSALWKDPFSTVSLD